MKKNYKLHLWIESDLFDKLRNQARDSNMAFTDFCRQKLRGNSQLLNIEIILSDIVRKLNAQLNLNQEV